MIPPKLATHAIQAILFDMNGTLRVREPHAPTQRAAIRRMLELLNKEDAPEAYWEDLTRRYKAYSQWAQANQVQLSEKEVWTRWILPDSPSGEIEPVAEELALAWTRRKGRALPKPDAGETIVALRQRGYRLGVISNTLSSLDIPTSLEAYGWKDHFEVVILTSALKIRKPAPEPFLEAAHTLSLEPAQCAYVGNRISKDLVGCKRAGFAFGILLEAPSGPRKDEPDQAVQPDAVIHSLGELLEIFPARRAGA